MLTPLKPCTYPGCNKLVKSGRCESHRKQADLKYEKDRESDLNRIFIHSNQWRVLRKIKLSNDPLCEICAKVGKVVVAVLVHHSDENEFNNSDENLISCCTNCHEDFHGPNRFKRRG